MRSALLRQVLLAYLVSCFIISYLIEFTTLLSVNFFFFLFLLGTQGFPIIKYKFVNVLIEWIYVKSL